MGIFGITKNTRSLRMKYKLPKHIKEYVKQELFDYKDNKRFVSELKGNTRLLNLTNKKIKQIEKVIYSLSEEDRELAEIIFIRQCPRERAYTDYGITKTVYYYAMDKIIFLTAREMELI